jgi:hypothetical protein
MRLAGSNAQPDAACNHTNTNAGKKNLRSMLAT